MTIQPKTVVIAAVFAIVVSGGFIANALSNAQSACARALDDAEMVERGLHVDVLDWSDPSGPSLSTALTLANGCRAALGIATSPDSSTPVWSALRRQCEPNADHGPARNLAGLTKDCEAWRLGTFAPK